MKPSKVDCGRNLCLINHMLMNDLDLICVKRRKKITAPPVNFVDFIFLILKFMHLLVAQFVIFMAKTKKKYGSKL